MCIRYDWYITYNVNAPVKNSFSTRTAERWRYRIKTAIICSCFWQVFGCDYSIRRNTVTPDPCCCINGYSNISRLLSTQVYHHFLAIVLPRLHELVMPVSNPEFSATVGKVLRKTFQPA